MDNKNKAPAILIVDDVEANRFVLRNIITNMQLQPILAENGLQALRIVERHRPSLILLDVAMPEMDGFEFCRIMKENPATREIPIIFISAYDEPDDIIKGFNLGGEDYITKPFIQEVVQARVGTHLKVHRAVRELAENNRRLQKSVNEQLDQIEKEKKRMLYAMLNVVRKNANYEEEHMERLRNNCKLFSQAMQLSPKYESLVSDSFVETMEVAAPLCDLGNVAIPNDILNKKGPLTEEERAMVNNHTTIGADLLREVMDEDYNDFVQMSIDIAHYHHENWDGSGYPEGLRGDEIPLAAQVVALISVYCALTEKRGFRPAFAREEAISIMEQDVNVKYNADLYGICAKIYRQFQ